MQSAKFWARTLRDDPERNPAEEFKELPGGGIWNIDLRGEGLEFRV